MELTINIKTERMENTGQGDISLKGSKDWCHFDRMSGWRTISQVEETAWIKARRSEQTRYVSRSDAPNSHLQILTHMRTHTHTQTCLRHRELKFRKTALQKLPGCYQL